MGVEVSMAFCLDPIAAADTLISKPDINYMERRYLCLEVRQIVRQVTGATDALNSVSQLCRRHQQLGNPVILSHT